jgi:hypothetical protein
MLVRLSHARRYKIIPPAIVVIFTRPVRGTPVKCSDQGKLALLSIVTAPTRKLFPRADLRYAAAFQAKTVIVFISRNAEFSDTVVISFSTIDS